MKVKVGNKIYDSGEEPVMVILSDQDKENIKNMLDHCTKYGSFPDGTSEEDMEEFMKTEEVKEAKLTLSERGDENLPASPESTTPVPSKKTVAEELAPILKQFPVSQFKALGIEEMDVEEISERLLQVMQHPIFNEREIQRELNYLPVTKKGFKLLYIMEKLLKLPAESIDPDTLETIRKEYIPMQELMEQAVLGYQSSISEEDKDYAEEFLEEKIDSLLVVVEPYAHPLLGDSVVSEQVNEDLQIDEPQKLIEGMMDNKPINIHLSTLKIEGAEDKDTWYFQDLKFTGAFGDAMTDLIKMAKSIGVKKIVLAGEYDRKIFPRDDLHPAKTDHAFDQKIALLRGMVVTACKRPKWYERDGVQVILCK